MQKISIKDLFKQINKKKWVALTFAWVVLVTFLFWIFKANDTIKVSEFNGNVAIYPSVFKSMVLFLQEGWNWLWLIPSLLMSAVLGFVLTLALDEEIDIEIGHVIFGMFVPAIASIAIIYFGGDRVHEFTHHTVTKEEYKAIEGKNVDHYFEKAFQVDSLYWTSFGKGAQ